MVVESRDSRLHHHMARLHDHDEPFTNEFGATLADVRQASSSIDQLLSTTAALNYDSKVAADMAAASKLLYWRFSKIVVEKILAAYRRESDSDEDFQELVANTTHTRIQPIDEDLGRAIIRSAKKHRGRPAAGVATLAEIQLAFELLGDALTVTDIIDSDIVSDQNAKRESVRRRINRGLDILEDAGYVSFTRDGRTIVWSSVGIESLSFPQHTLSQSFSISAQRSNAVSNVGN